MRRRVIECVANFSEGRDAEVVRALESAVSGGHGVALLHSTMDPDHNRCVISFAGTPDGVVSAALRAVTIASRKIDLRQHRGVHPRLGAADVVPLVPVEGITLEECVSLAWYLGEQIWTTTGVPVYFYEAAARRPERIRLENVRRGGFEGRTEALRNAPELAPDIGPPQLHPSAGAVIVGARKILIAYNFNLATEELSVAQAIARLIRSSSGGLPHVKALGLPLRSRKQVQVSVNLTDFEQTPLHVVHQAVVGEAHLRGVELAGAEIIGLIPRAALGQAAEHYLRLENFRPEAVLEDRISELLPPAKDQFDFLADPSRPPGETNTAAVSGAMASALGVRVCRLLGRDHSRLLDSWQFLTRAADLHANNLESAAEAALDIAETARNIETDLSSLRSSCPERDVPEIATASALASASRLGGAAAARIKITALSEESTRTRLERRLRTIE